MIKLDESNLGDKIKDLIRKVRKEVEPLELNIYKDVGVKDIKVETKVDEKGNFNVIIYEEEQEEFFISLEILGLLSQKYVPSFIRVLQFDIVGNIGKQIQTYLSSKWIMEEQKKIGIEPEIRRMLPNVEKILNLDNNPYNKITKILLVNSMIRFYPESIKNYNEIILDNCPDVLKYSNEIMKSILENDMDNKVSTKKAIVKSIKQWNTVLMDLGIDIGDLQMLISVTPVFKERQRDVKASSIFKIIPDAIIDDTTSLHNHIILTLKDNQTAAHFQMDKINLEELMRKLDTLTLKEFLEIFAVPFYLE
ncbi:hypothetical protein [Clostridium sp. DL1XJH146]